MAEQRFLAFGAPAVAAGRPVGADHPMTRHDQRHRVGGAGPRDGPDGGRPANRLARPAGRSGPRRRESPAGPARPAVRRRCRRRRRAAPRRRRSSELPPDRGDVYRAGRRPAATSSARGKLGREIGLERAGVVAEHHPADAALGGARRAAGRTASARRRRGCARRRRRGGRRRASCRDGGRPVRRRRGSNP